MKLLSAFIMAAAMSAAAQESHQQHERVQVEPREAPAPQPKERKEAETLAPHHERAQQRGHVQHARPDAEHAAQPDAARAAKKPPPPDCSEGTDCFEARMQQRAEGARRQAETSPGASTCRQEICAHCDGICAPATPGGVCSCQKR